MKTWLVDTKVLLDVMGADRTFGEASGDVLPGFAEAGRLVSNPIVHAEVAVCIQTREKLDELVPGVLFERESLPWDAAYRAAQAFARYRDRGGDKQSLVAHFIIFAHAPVAGP